MPRDTPDTEADRPREGGAKGGKAKLLTLDALDKRTKSAQRALDMRDRLAAERGGVESLSVLRFAMVESVAVVSAMVTDVQIRWLRGEPIDMTELATLLNARRREAQMIGLDGGPRDVTPTLATYLAGKAMVPDG